MERFTTSFDSFSFSFGLSKSVTLGRIGVEGDLDGALVMVFVVEVVGVVLSDINFWPKNENCERPKANCLFLGSNSLARLENVVRNWEFVARITANISNTETRHLLDILSVSVKQRIVE